MEEYLSRCIDSLVKSNKVADLEVVIVNDGSKDRSLEIAKSYQSSYPGSIIIIDKPNGNYGSTINAALPIITGKYVKILDADDWFDTDALNLFIERLSLTECDLILTPYTRDYVGEKKQIVTIGGLQEAKTYDFESFMSSAKIKNGLRMHSVAYKREVVTDNNYSQTEGISYTDNEWIFYPLFHVKRAEWVDLNLYQHFIGRSEQTTAPKVRVKNFWQELAITTKMVRSYNDYASQAPEEHQKEMLKKLVERVQSNYTFVLLHGYTEVNVEQLRQLKAELTQHPRILSLAENHTIGSPLRIGTLSYWNKTERRYPLCVRLYLKVRARIGTFLRKS